MRWQALAANNSYISPGNVKVDGTMYGALVRYESTKQQILRLGTFLKQETMMPVKNRKESMESLTIKPPKQ